MSRAAPRKETSYLVVGAEAGTKLAKAQQLGTALLDDAAFAALLRERGVEVPD